MFKLFKKKSELDVLNEKYQKIQHEAFKLSKTNRIESDLKYAEADELMNKIQKLEEQQGG